MVVLRITASTPKGIRLLALSKKLPMLFHHNATGRPMRKCVYMGVDCHYRLFLHTILSTTPV